MEFLNYERDLTRNYYKLRCMRKNLSAEEIKMRKSMTWNIMQKKLFKLYLAGILSYLQYDYVNEILCEMFSDKIFNQNEPVVVQFRIPGCKYYL